MTLTRVEGDSGESTNLIWQIEFSTLGVKTEIILIWSVLTLQW